MDAKPKDAYHHRDLRTALIKTAKKAVDVEGPEKLSLRCLAQQLNVSHAAVYRHFENKDALLVQVAIAGFEQLVRALKRAGRRHDDPESALVRVSMAYVRFGMRNPGLYDLLFSPAVQHNEESKAHADGALAVVVEIIARAEPIGRARDDFDLTNLARSAWALVHGLVDLNRRDQFGDTTQKEVLARAEALLRAMLSGLTA